MGSKVKPVPRELPKFMIAIGPLILIGKLYEFINKANTVTHIKQAHSLSLQIQSYSSKCTVAVVFYSASNMKVFTTLLLLGCLAISTVNCRGDFAQVFEMGASIDGKNRN